MVIRDDIMALGIAAALVAVLLIASANTYFHVQYLPPFERVFALKSTDGFRFIASAARRLT